MFDVHSKSASLHERDFLFSHKDKHLMVVLCQIRYESIYTYICMRTFMPSTGRELTVHMCVFLVGLSFVSSHNNSCGDLKCTHNNLYLFLSVSSYSI